MDDGETHRTAWSKKLRRSATGRSIPLACLGRADLRKGQSILIYGAPGSIGTAAVRPARYVEADVTAVCNTKNVEIVGSFGVDRVIDDAQEDFTKNGETYVDFDAVGRAHRGNYRAVIDRRYPLEDVVEATRYVETGRRRGTSS